MLVVDSWSSCGNCLPWGASEEFEVEFDGPWRMHLTSREDRSRFSDFDGWFKRVAVTEELIRELVVQSESGIEEESHHARKILFALEDAERRNLTFDNVSSLKASLPPTN